MREDNKRSGLASQDDFYNKPDEICSLLFGHGITGEPVTYPVLIPPTKRVKFQGLSGRSKPWNSS
jgi:hypothetical protein